ncbi:MAG: carboxypeptidase-like regulatory domain-containing protein [Saprospirales bacterium]|nr:carboxypeptidase-like regulatory domain-containing protein [Saprospirales bacterium]MBK6904315.1 carboxypeptidase-like regulatory domain-containing protein [Saprospirales bacterium]
MKLCNLLLSGLLLLVSVNLHAQTGGVRGNVFDKASGEPILYGTIILEGTSFGTNTDLDGFFSIPNIPAGAYQLIITYIGYDSLRVAVDITANTYNYQRLFIEESSVQLGTVNVSARKEKAKADVQISEITLTPRQIQALPSTGGDPDIAQYLTVLPGIITSGDQGGQLYIRGGAPIQNLILLDGMTIYNPFHSIGFYSVFETETIRSVDVLTGGFNAEYGGRISSVLDIRTREGNMKRLGGLVSASPFMARAVLEGPLKKLEADGGGSSSFMVTAKHSYIDQTSKYLYSYAKSALDSSSNSLPFTFTDFYGKMSFLTGNGTKFNLFGFNFRDGVDYLAANLDWNTTGGGMNFTVVPPNSNLIFGGTIGYSDYMITLVESGEDPRTSRIGNVSALLDFTYFGGKSQLNYGIQFNGINTDFVFRNFLDITIQQKDFTTELSGFLIYKQRLANWVLEPSLRIQMYASQGNTSIEPRFGAKYNASKKFRLKFAGGMYSQNLTSSVNEQDVINLFVGFLTGPEQTIYEPGTQTPANHRLQKSIHGIAGMEIDLVDNLELNVEGYYKGFTQLINLNRNKRRAQDPDFATETGEAYGADLSLRYETPSLYLWGTYSLTYVFRNDGEQVYPTVFDRRHNVNLLGTYSFGNKKTWEFGLRWNFGSPFPFTQTLGFYPFVNFLEEGLGTDPKTDNPPLGIIYTPELNGGRLISFHRLDASLKRRFSLSENLSLEASASVTNLYNRRNIFYIDRKTAERVDQLPLLPSLSLTMHF